MKRYVGGFVFCKGFVLLVRKNHGPDKLIGTWNAIGGKAEPGESNQDAITRESKEETGLDLYWPSYNKYCTLTNRGRTWEVAFFRLFLDSLLLPPIKPEKDNGERVEWIHLGSLFSRSNEMLASDVKWLLPMAMDPRLPAAGRVTEVGLDEMVLLPFSR